MCSVKDTIISKIIKIEGGYSDNPDDSGGPTKYGVTEAVARANGYTGDMKDLPRGFAVKLYEKVYWDSLSLDSIEKKSEKIAYELADTGINMGVGRAAEFLQRCLNALNKEGSLYTDIKVDGNIGPRTIGAFYAFMGIRKTGGERVLLRMLNSLQGEWYISLAERRQKDESFVYGWFEDRVEMP